MPNTSHPTTRLGETRVREVLEPDQLSASKHRFGPARLTRGTVVLFWALRIYVVLMTLLVGLQIWNAVHAGG
jgi:hypothetical protein